MLLHLTFINAHLTFLTFTHLFYYHLIISTANYLLFLCTDTPKGIQVVVRYSFRIIHKTNNNAILRCVLILRLYWVVHEWYLSVSHWNKQCNCSSICGHFLSQQCTKYGYGILPSKLSNSGSTRFPQGFCTGSVRVFWGSARVLCWPHKTFMESSTTPTHHTQPPTPPHNNHLLTHTNTFHPHLNHLNHLAVANG